jgi:hypothetical protein
MLNVPETVKTLFKRDGVRKNFRVHFPNGELPDITNENIVQESVKFTESLCSQDVLKFGLTEASVIEFETVGIANMYGMQIECGIEIDLSSLSAAQLNDIASGTWDGVYTPLGSSDIGYAYFRVPYGVFRVESCPRDHQAMAHRKVKAFGYLSENLLQNWFEVKKLDLQIGYDTVKYGKEQDIIYDPYIKPFILSQIAWDDENYLENNGYTKTSVSMSDVVQPTLNYNYWGSKVLSLLTTGGGQKVGYLRIKGKFSCTNVSLSPSSYLWETNLTDRQTSLYSVVQSLTAEELKESFLSQLETLIESYNIDLAANGFNSVEELADEYIGDLYKPGIEISQKGNSENQGAFPTVQGGADGEYIGIGGNNYALYLYRPKTVACFYSPTTIQFFEGSISLPSASIYKYTDSNPDTFSTLKLAISPTLRTQRYRHDGSLLTYCASYTNGYSIKKIMNGYLELCAQFGRTNRYNNFVMMRLSTSSPVAITQDNYSEFWWDEYDVLPIGSINYTFTDSDNNASVVSYQFGGGASIYDMTDNDLIKYLSGMTESTINSLLDSLFIPYLLPIAFTPIDMTMKGLPYIESGDYLAVTAEDGMIANSFNMKQDISGIQVLTASIESTSGDIIESGEST